MQHATPRSQRKPPVLSHASTSPTQVYFFLETEPTFYEVQELKTLLEN